MPSPTCEVRHGANPFVSTVDGVDVPTSATVRIRLEDDAGVDSWTIECIATDETSDAATLTGALTIDPLAKTADFSSGATAGKTFIFRSTVNNGRNAQGETDASLVTTFGVYILTGSGFRVLAVNETTEGSAAYGWIVSLNAFVRTGAGGGSPPTGTGFRHVTGGVEDGAAKLVENADVHASAGIAYSKMGTGSQSVGAQQFSSTVDAKGTVRDVLPKNVGTTDDTVTTLETVTVPTNTAVLWTVVVAALKSDGTQAASYTRSALFRRAAGSASLVGSVVDGLTIEDDSAWDCTIDLSGNDARCRVTGVAATNIRWTLVSERLEVVY